MNLTPWKEEDDGSIFECHASLRSGLSPIFKLRAVKLMDGKYSAVVRDYITGILLSQNQPDTNVGYPLDFAQRKSIELAQLVLMFDSSKECVIIHKWICPHESISGKHCTYCKIPDLYRTINDNQIILNNQTILKNLKERHDVEITLTKEIDALINYTRHISYNECWIDNLKK